MNLKEIYGIILIFSSLGTFYASNSLQYIGPHNLLDHFIKIESMTSGRDILDRIRAIYHIEPIRRDLERVRLSNQDKFKVIIKREVAWSYPEYNEFGLLSCDEDLHFSQPIGPVGYMELIPDGRRIHIQKFDKKKRYKRAAQAAKDLQTQCLIKSLEKSSTGSGKELNCETGIPFCFSDSWQQIWWKVPE